MKNIHFYYSITEYRNSFSRIMEFRCLRYKSRFLIGGMRLKESERIMPGWPQSCRASGLQVRNCGLSHILIRELGRSITEISRRDVDTRGERTDLQPLYACVRVTHYVHFALMKQLDWPGLLLRRCRHSLREGKMQYTSYNYRSLMVIITFLLDERNNLLFLYYLVLEYWFETKYSAFKAAYTLYTMHTYTYRLFNFLSCLHILYHVKYKTFRIVHYFI